MKRIWRIVLTGGPCSGKSTFMERAIAHFTNIGYQVFVDHEAATDLITGGISPASMGMYQFQKYVIGLQLKKEDLFVEAAKEIVHEKVLVFYDRGIFDDKGYVSPSEFKEILDTFNYTEEEIIDRYDMVLHLTSTAKSNPEFYTFLNNAARYEDVDGAIKVDNTILDSWSVHPNQVVIDDEADFDLKMAKAIAAVELFVNK